MTSQIGTWTSGVVHIPLPWNLYMSTHGCYGPEVTSAGHLGSGRPKVNADTHERPIEWPPRRNENTAAIGEEV